MKLVLCSNFETLLCAGSPYLMLTVRKNVFLPPSSAAVTDIFSLYCLFAGQQAIKWSGNKGLLWQTTYLYCPHVQAFIFVPMRQRNLSLKSRHSCKILNFVM